MAQNVTFLVMAATAENYNYSKNDDPGAVVVKEMAQAVVVHRICSSDVCLRFFALTYILCLCDILVTDIF